MGEFIIAPSQVLMKEGGNVVRSFAIRPKDPTKGLTESRKSQDLWSRLAKLLDVLLSGKKVIIECQNEEEAKQAFEDLKTFSEKMGYQ